jgi:hypothetical protein
MQGVSDGGYRLESPYHSKYYCFGLPVLKILTI